MTKQSESVTPDKKRNPVTVWQSEFGNRYIERNEITTTTTRDAKAVFKRILDECGIRREIKSVLEVGANIGVNLTALRQLLGTKIKLAAVEPNPIACERLRSNKSLALENIMERDAYKIPLADNSVDLVFTNGVLIHIPPERLPIAMREITRVARKWVLCSEYFSHLPVEIPYRGQSGLLWKRDFGGTYLDTCPKLKPHRYGFIWQREFPTFDDFNWWVFKKSRA
jgi:pseudaminic acid biosynthesis-associated methylase